MTNKTILLALLLSPFFGLNAQDVASEPMEPRQYVFESVSFSSSSGNITITCKELDKLSDFEIIGQDAHLNFSWDDKTPADRFPMKLGIKPGKVIVKYKMRGEKFKTVELKLEAREEVKLAL